MRFVPSNNVDQIDIQAIHRVHSQLVRNKTALANQIRGLLLEYGVVIPQGFSNVKKRLPVILSEDHLTPLSQPLFTDLYQNLLSLEEKVKQYDKQLLLLCKQNEACTRISEIEGIGPLTATAIVAAVCNGNDFKNGRHMAAWLGLTPRQYSSGNKQVLLGISSRCDSYLRMLLIHGARAALYRMKPSESLKYKWVTNLAARVGMNRACVALANKNARIIWAMLYHTEHYRSSI